MPKLKPVPKFKNEDDERNFWAKANTLDYFDSRSAKRVIFSNLKPSNKSISLRLPSALLEHLKSLANQKDVPYQSLAKIFLAERVREELTPKMR